LTTSLATRIYGGNMLKRLALVLALFLFAANLRAGSALAGDWQADVTGEAKTFTIVFHFTVTQNAIRGSLELPSQDREFPITEGSIHGNEFTFKSAGLWHGTFDGKILTLTRELDGGKKQHMTARRVAQQ
jgi:hypothetical protein